MHDCFFIYSLEYGFIKADGLICIKDYRWNKNGFQRSLTFGAWVWARRECPNAGWLRGGRFAVSGGDEDPDDHAAEVAGVLKKKLKIGKRKAETGWFNNGLNRRSAALRPIQFFGD